MNNETKIPGDRKKITTARIAAKIKIPPVPNPPGSFEPQLGQLDAVE